MCTPRYMREKAMSRITAAYTARQSVLRDHMPRQPKLAKAFCVWPLGKE